MRINGIVTEFHKHRTKAIGLTTNIQSVVLKKPLERVSLEYRKGGGVAHLRDLDKVAGIVKVSQAAEVSVSPAE